MTRSLTSRKIGFLGGAAIAGTLLAGSLLASAAVAQTPPGPGWGPGSGPRMGGFGPPAGVVRPGAGPVAGYGVEHEAIAEALGISSEELYTLRAGGTSIAQIAQEKGVPLETVTDAILQAHRAQLDQRVRDGTLTQAQADAMLSLMKARVEASVQATGVGPRSGMMGPRGGMMGPAFGPGFGPGFGPRWGVPTP